jgi:malate/lactate dehydrogenase
MRHAACGISPVCDCKKPKPRKIIGAVTMVDDIRFATMVKATVKIAVIRRPVSMRPAPD